MTKRSVTRRTRHAATHQQTRACVLALKMPLCVCPVVCVCTTGTTFFPFSEEKDKHQQQSGARGRKKWKKNIFLSSCLSEIFCKKKQQWKRTNKETCIGFRSGEPWPMLYPGAGRTAGMELWRLKRIQSFCTRHNRSLHCGGQTAQFRVHLFTPAHTHPHGRSVGRCSFI